MTNLFTDYETQSLLDVGDVGTANYVEHPSTKPILFSWAVDRGKAHVWECQYDPMPSELKDAFTDPHVTKLAWRVPFERGITASCLKIPTRIEDWFDVMVLARYLSFPGKLEEACDAMELPLEIRKMADAGKTGIQLFSIPVHLGGKVTFWGVEPPFFNSRDNKPREWEEFKKYNIQDTVVEQHIFYSLCDKFMLPPDEIQMWYLDQIINERGMPVAVDFAKNGLELAKMSIAETRKTLVSMTGLENPNSDSQVLEWVRARGYPYTSMNKNLVKLVLDDPQTPLTPEAQQVLHIRKEFRRSSYTKLESIVNRVSPDGRLRDCFAFMGGARTGRWCLAAGSPVLVKNELGIVLERPIESVLLTDKVWDGENWVQHKGVAFSGNYDIIEWDGIRATKDHLVWTSPTTKITLGKAMETKQSLWTGDSRQYTIYRLTSPSGKCYVGLTIQPLKTRWLNHVRRSRKGLNHPLHNAIRKYGAASFTVEVIDHAKNLEQAKKLEILHVAAIPEGMKYNVSKGGDYDGPTGGKVFWGSLSDDEKKTYIQKLSTIKKENDWTDYIQLSELAEKWRKENPRLAWKQLYRASRLALRKNGAAPVIVDNRPLKEKLLWKHKRGHQTQKNALKQWAKCSPERRKEIGEKIRKKRIQYFANMTLEERRAATQKARISRTGRA